MNSKNITTKINDNVILFGTPLLLILFVVLITQSKIFDTHTNTLSIGITLDLLFTIPTIFFLLSKKKNIPKITTASFFVLGIITSSYIIPKEHQSLLNLIKTWVFPFIELGVVIFVYYKVRQTIKRFKINAKNEVDFFSVLRATCLQILPKKIAILLTMELAIFYFGFIYWKKKAIADNEFTYHKNSGTLSLLSALIIIIGIETYALHFLLLKWNTSAAWIASIISIYSSIQIFGFLKSIIKRPFSIEGHKIHLRYGILSETTIDVNDIESVEIISKEIKFDTQTRKLSPLGALESHNIVISLKKENRLIGLYGMNKNYKTLAFFIDDPKNFKTTLEHLIKK
ncbi:hypothetical protein [Aquimarina sediminis]|uniref:hypothetical protein n=1 Tax=Aquimarina sediminis TaxID=2070536 RepID=UPI000CA0284E|nr:hypothetical protein [Aquimarina sediminis]